MEAVSDVAGSQSVTVSRTREDRPGSGPPILGRENRLTHIVEGSMGSVIPRVDGMLCSSTLPISGSGVTLQPQKAVLGQGHSSLARRVSELGFLALFRTTGQCSLGFAIPRCLGFGSI